MTAEEYVKHYASGQGGYESVSVDVALIAIRYAKQEMKQQFEKNRLEHCNSITNEQAELEQGFIDQHLDKHKRMPTYLDAIEYGMNLQKEQMMRGAIDGQLENGEDYLRIKCLSMGCHYLEGDGKFVKLIIIKED